MKPACNNLKPLLRCLQFLLILSLWGPFSAGADRIILKDGTIEHSDRVWESERYVHFILQGTRSVEIRYAKEIVARIEGPDGFPVRKIKPAGKPEKPAAPPPSPSRMKTLSSRNDGEKLHVADLKDHDIDRSVIQSNRGIKFFDPRRPQKYWASRNSKHDSVSAAIDALSKIYHQPPVWIEMHMGEENDLGLIHANLIAAFDKARERLMRGNHEDALGVSDSLPVVDGAPDTMKEAGDDSEAGLEPALSNEASKKEDRDQPSTVEISTETEKRAPGAVVNSTVRVPVSAGSPDHPDFFKIPQGVSFYDPRRPEKYWVDETHHFNSLDDALRQLSALYGVSQEWIGDHLGNSNDLREIHRSIRESLTSE